MSTRFFFDVTNGDETIRDEVGVEGVSLDEVLAEARVVVAEMAYDVIKVDPDASWALIVRDEAGSPIGSIPIEQ
ncbi:DUF6894 family protein [Methylobacterium sp. CM6246]